MRTWRTGLFPYTKGMAGVDRSDQMLSYHEMNNYRSNFLNNNPFLLMCKHFNDLSSKVDYSSSYFVVKKEILNLCILNTETGPKKISH